MVDLNGIWDFAFQKDSDKLASSFPFAAVVPGCFDTTVEFGGRRGVGFYRRKIDMEKDFKYRLILEGVSHNSQVYLNRKLLAQHHGGFTSFYVDLPPETTGCHELVIVADNRFDGLDRPLHMPHFDWYSYGGIIRPVILEKWQNVLIEKIEPVIKDWKKGRATLRVHCRFAEGCRLPMELLVFEGEKLLVKKKVEIKRSPVEVDIEIPSAEPWSPENPRLYNIRVEIAGSQKAINIGFRDIRTEGRDILFNDRPIRLRGVNRHDSCIQFGFAMPPALFLYDVQKIKELGCNFVRTSHYPPDERFIDLCDKMGLLVWCEATAWQYDESMMVDERTMQAQKQCITEMIEQYCHHPSIICWGLLNECASDRILAKGSYKELIGLIRRLDPSRPVTYATMYCISAATLAEAEIKDVMFDLVDWISFNCYPGWYSGGPEDCTERLENLAKRFEEAGFNKPIIISEIGAGGIAGFDHYYPVKWSLSYQSILLEKLLEYIRKKTLFNGVVIWHYADILTSEERWQRRPRQFNDKGLLDEFRRCKPVFEKVKQIFKKQW